MVVLDYCSLAVGNPLRNRHHHHLLNFNLIKEFIIIITVKAISATTDVLEAFNFVELIAIAVD